MAKPFKIFLIVVGVFLALIAIAALAVTFAVNPDNYKGKIVTSVKDQTGRDLTIGSIKLSVFPWLGASVQGVTVGNAQGFGPEPFAQLAEVDVRVKLLPLFHRRVEIGKVTVNGLALNLAKDKEGHDNWSDLSKHDEKAGHSHVEGEIKTGKPFAVTVGGIAIKDASFAYADAQKGAAYKIDKLSVETGPVELNEPLDVTIAFLISSAQPKLESDVKISFTAIAKLDEKTYELKDLKVDSTTKGDTVPGGSQKASVRGGALYDQGKGAFTFSDGVLEAAGLTLNASVHGEGLNGDSPALTGKIATNTFNPKELAKSFGVALPPTADAKALTAASFSTTIGGDTKNAKLENLTLKLDQTTATGNVTIKDFAAPLIQFALKADSFDADRYLAPASAAGKDDKASGGGDFKKTQIPVDALDAINASGTVALNSLKLKGMSLSDILVTINAPKGQPKTEVLAAKLYGGKVAQEAKLTPGKTPKYDMKLGLAGVNSAPLLKDLSGKTYLSGLGNFNLNFASTGSTVGDILQAMSGATALSFQNGAVEGFNLEQTLQQARALYKGEPLPAASGPARTEFKDLKGSGKITNGVLDTDTLNIAGSGFSAAGDGTINLVDQTLDYLLTVSADKYPELKGTKVPVKLTGSLTDPKVKLDAGSLVKGRAQQEVQKQEEKLKSKFGDFLNKKLGPKPAPAPEEKPSGG